MHDRLGPRVRRVYIDLREGILRGDYATGTALPAATKLATQFGVSTVTARHAVAQLEHEGLVSRQQGRGTYVKDHVPPSVLIVDDDENMRELLRNYARRAGHRAMTVGSPDAALAALISDPSIALILSDVRVPGRADGVAFIRNVHHRWPSLPLAAITGFPDDLAELHGTPECPVLILAKPVREHQVQEVFRWVLGTKHLS